MEMTSAISRRSRVYNGTELVSTTYRDVTWEELKLVRLEALQNTDWWVLRGNMTDAQAAYRQFLRDLPQNYAEAGANAACDAWEAYDVSAL